MGTIGDKKLGEILEIKYGVGLEKYESSLDYAAEIYDY